MSQLEFACSLSWQCRTAGEECWPRGGGESQLFSVSDIGVIVCTERLGCEFSSAHSCGSSTRHAGQMGPGL